MSDLNPSFTKVQVKGFGDIIHRLSTEDIFDLKDSVTKKAIDVSSREEAFTAIISFSTSPQELLQRKKITRNLLIQYAFAEKITIAGNADKKEIIGKILNHWKKGETNLQPTQLEKHVNPVSPTQIVHPVAPSQTVHPVAPSQTVHPVAPSQTVHPVAPSQTVHPVAQSQTMHPVAPSQTGDLHTFGQTFASWFYKMLNSHNRQMNTSPPLDFGPHHFWPDSTLQANTITDGNAIGAVKTAEKLLYFVKEGLYFNANVNNGVSTKSESHGLICVLVHGTVHQEQFCLGTFEQAFTLLQDPSDNNNWKIKNVWLNVHTASNESRSIQPS